MEQLIKEERENNKFSELITEEYKVEVKRNSYFQTPPFEKRHEKNLNKLKIKIKTTIKHLLAKKLKQ